MINSIKSRLKRLFVQLPKLASNLSVSFFGAIFLYFKLAYFVITRQSLLRDKPLNFIFTHNGKKFELELLDNLDITVIVEIFALMEYEWNIGFNPKTILDLGAHWGDTAIYYALAYPDTSILSVEPAPKTYVRLEALAKKYPQITPIHGALASSSGNINLYMFDSSLGNSMVDRKNGAGEKVMVPGLTMENLCSKAGVKKFDLIKFDIEGAEEILFKVGNLADYARAYIGEIHLDLMSMSLNDIERVFSDFECTINSIGKDRYIIKAKLLN